MIRRSKTLSMLALLGACQSEPDVAADLAALKGAPGEAPASAASAEVIEVDWPSLGSCRDQLRELLRIVTSGAAPEPTDLPFGVVVGPAVERDRLSAPSVPIAADLPLPVGNAAAREAPCLLQVGLPDDIESKRRIVGQETVASEYQSGVRREDNPAYELAKAKVDMAKRRAKYDDEVWAGVGDPMIDLVGLLVGSIVEGFSEGARESDLEEAMIELARTPRKIDRPAYASYHFDRVVVDAARRASIPVELIDRRQGTRSRTVIRHVEQRRFHIPQGLSRRDRNYAEHTADGSQRDLKTWLRSPPELPLTRVVRAVLDDPHGKARPAGRWQQADEVRSAATDAGVEPWTGPSPALARTRMTDDASEVADVETPASRFDDDPDLIRFDDPADRQPLSVEFERPFGATGQSRLVERTRPDEAAAFSELASDD
ncbi:MAG: hypothetical protein R3349_07075, partial [Geminicoccaceae bacterium]|nr:hypothetical protein [Geminicoccaceae bacterium]